MPSLFVVVTQSDTPRLYVAQKPYEEVLRSLRAWPYSHTRRSFVFEPRMIPSVGANPHGDPSNHMQLTLTGIVEPNDEVESYQYQWIGALDKLPLDQAVLKAQFARDYLDKIMLRLESRLKTPEGTPEG